MITFDAVGPPSCAERLCWKGRHAQKYSGIQAALNLVPSLVSQPQEYARDMVHEQAFGPAFKPVPEFSLKDREKPLEVSFQIDLKNQLN